MSKLEDGLRARIAELEAELAEGDRIDRFNQKYTDGIEEALEEVEAELVAERAKAIEADQLRADAEREIEYLRQELEGIVEERDKANQEAEEAEEGATEGWEALRTARDAFLDYMVSIGEPADSLRRPSRELQALCDALRAE